MSHFIVQAVMSNKLAYELQRLCYSNRDGSYTTQYQRSRSLRTMADDLKSIGYRNMRASSLKPKHVKALVDQWHAQELSTGTIKNRMAHIRWWADKIGKPSVVPADNITLGIDNRVHVTNVNRAAELDERLHSISDLKIRASLELQRAFGLRREESIKLQPAVADQGDRLVLKPSWTKGGRAREIPICTSEQRRVLNEARKVSSNGYMIPENRNYFQHLKIYERQINKAGFSKLHGLRHAYAQDRYQELTGRPAPAAGGPRVKHMSAEDKRQDEAARQTISRELGHERIEVTSVYLGR